MKKLIMIALAISLCTTSAFASESPEPIYSVNFYSSDSEPMPNSVFVLPLLDLHIENIDIDFTKEYYFKFDDLIFKSSFFLVPLDGVGYYLAGDVSFFDTFTLSSEVPFSLMIISSNPGGALYYSLDCFSSDVDYHSFAIYDCNPFSGASSQDFMSSLNDGTLEDASDILDSSLNELPDLSQNSNFTSFLSAALAWVPSEYWAIYALCFVLLIVRVVMAFLWR